MPQDDPFAIVQVIDFGLQNPQKVAEIIEQGQQDAREQTWEHNARQYIELFQKIVGRE